MSALPLPRCNLIIHLLRKLLARSVSLEQTSCLPSDCSSESLLQACEKSQVSASATPMHIRWSDPLVNSVSARPPRRRQHLRWASQLVTVIADKEPAQPLKVRWTEPLIQGISDNLPEHSEYARASFVAKRTRTNKGEYPSTAAAIKVAHVGAKDEGASQLAAKEKVRFRVEKGIRSRADGIFDFAEEERWDRFAAHEVWAQEYELGNYDWMY